MQLDGDDYERKITREAWKDVFSAVVFKKIPLKTDKAQHWQPATAATRQGAVPRYLWVDSDTHSSSSFPLRNFTRFDLQPRKRENSLVRENWLKQRVKEDGLPFKHWRQVKFPVRRYLQQHQLPYDPKEHAAFVRRRRAKRRVRFAETYTLSSDSSEDLEPPRKRPATKLTDKNDSGSDSESEPSTDDELRACRNLKLRRTTRR